MKKKLYSMVVLFISLYLIFTPISVNAESSDVTAYSGGNPEWKPN